jgi:hypothetical protein
MRIRVSRKSHNLKNEILIKMWNQTHRERRNCIIVIVGKPGKGKSTLAMRVVEVLDKSFRPKNMEEAERLIRSRIVVEPEKFTEAVANNPELKRHRGIILDEAGQAFSYEVWQSITNRMLSTLLQTWRWRRLYAIFTVPTLKFFTVQGRRLIDYIIVTDDVDFDKKKTTTHIRTNDVNPISGKPYIKRFKHTKHGFTRINKSFIWQRPNGYLMAAYEKWIEPQKKRIERESHEGIVNAKRMAVEKEKLKNSRNAPFNLESMVREANRLGLRTNADIRYKLGLSEYKSRVVGEAVRRTGKYSREGVKSAELNSRESEKKENIVK